MDMDYELNIPDLDLDIDPELDEHVFGQLSWDEGFQGGSGEGNS
jgi:hypothetical protein